MLLLPWRRPKQLSREELVALRNTPMSVKEIAGFNKRRNSPYKKPADDGRDNMILAKHLRLGMNYERTRRNLNVLAFGPDIVDELVVPNLMQFNSNWVIPDHNGELVRKYGSILEKNGYVVKVFDLSCKKPDIYYNPLSHIREGHEYEDAYVIANNFVIDTYNPGREPTELDKEAVDLITLVILYVHFSFLAKDRHLGTVYDIFNKLSESGNIVNDIDNMMIDGVEDAAAWNKVWDKWEGVNKSDIKDLVAIACESLKMFILPDAREMTSYSNLNMVDFDRTKQVLFINVPGVDSMFVPLLSTMYCQMFTALCKVNKKDSNKLIKRIDTIHTHFLVNEHVSVNKWINGSISMHPGKGYNFSFIFDFRSFLTMKYLYGDENYMYIAGICDIKYWGGSYDVETIKSFFKWTADPGWAWEKLDPDLLMAAKENECYIRVRGEPPYFGKKAS